MQTSKTTMAGIGVILAGIAGACTALGNGAELVSVLGGVGTALMAGLGLILAKDHQAPAPLPEPPPQARPAAAPSSEEIDVERVAGEITSTLKTASPAERASLLRVIERLNGPAKRKQLEDWIAEGMPGA